VGVLQKKKRSSVVECRRVLSTFHLFSVILYNALTLHQGVYSIYKSHFIKMMIRLWWL